MDLTDVIGSTGRAQVKTFLVVLLRPFAGALTYISIMISLIELQHWCSPTPAYSNLTSTEWKECCVPKKYSGSYSKCEYYEEEAGFNNTRQALVCTSWDYDYSTQYQSIRAEWNLVCDRGWYVSMIYLAFTLGNMVAYIPTGYFADRFGRKNVVAVSLVLISASAFGSAFCTSVEQMIVARFFTGMFYATTQNPLNCLYLECTGPEYRDWLILVFSGSWGIGLILFGGITYYITNWRTVFILASFPIHLTLALVLWWFVPESARWLLSVKRYEEAEKIIVQQTKENGIQLLDPKGIMEELKKKVEMDKTKQGRATLLDLLKDKGVRRTTMLLFITYVLTVFINHGYHISSGRLDGSLHMNQIFNGIADTASAILLFLLVKYVSKRKGILVTSLLTGISFLVTIPVGDEMRWLRVTFAMFGRFCNSAAYNLLYLMSSELFPTNLRVAAISSGMMSGRIGSLLAAFTDDMGRVYGRNAAITLFGILSLVTTGTVFLLPEISNRNLPDSLAETKMLTTRKGKLEAVVS